MNVTKIVILCWKVSLQINCLSESLPLPQSEYLTLACQSPVSHLKLNKREEISVDDSFSSVFVTKHKLLEKVARVILTDAPSLQNKVFKSCNVKHFQIHPRSKAKKITKQKNNERSIVTQKFLQMLKGKQEFDSLSWCTKRSKRKCAEIFCRTECISGKGSALHTFNGFHIFQLKNKCN